MSQFNFSIEHIKGKENVIADVLSRCEYKETEIPTSEDHSPPSPSHSTTPSISSNLPHSSNNLINSTTKTISTMPPIRSTKRKTPTPGPYRRRSLSPLPNLAEMWERTTNPPPQAVYTATVQTRAQAQRGRYIPLNQLGPGQTSPGRS